MPPCAALARCRRLLPPAARYFKLASVILGSASALPAGRELRAALARKIAVTTPSSAVG